MTHRTRPASRGPGAPLDLLAARRRLMLAAALGLPWIGGCVVAPMEPQAVSYGQPVYVQAPPPAPLYEAVGASPYPGYVWIGGYWAWQLNRHVWVGGHWAPPRTGYRWAPPSWERGQRGWWMREGRWSHR